jgi:murein L,D-transpeptidase YcbB/YkuD
MYLLTFCLLGISFASSAALEDEVIRTEIEQMRLAEHHLVAGEPVTGGELLMRLYESRAFKPFWERIDRRRALMNAIVGVEADGLDPRDYHLVTLVRMGASEEDPAHFDPLRRGQRDVLLTDALLRLSGHLLSGKVDPEQLNPAWNLRRGSDGRRPLEVAQALLGSESLEAALDSLKPTHEFYLSLKSALARHREIAAVAGWPLVPRGPTLRQGDSGERVLAIRARLAVTDLVEGTAPKPRVFDGELADAVRRFQKRHGLSVDGAVGGRTLAAMNVSTEDRVAQIRANLERSRWVLNDLEPEFVLVDIAGFQVLYVRNSEVIWRSRVVVGRNYRKTPIFRGELRYLVLNPSWTLPPTILAEDVLPAIQGDRHYLTTRNIRVLDAKGTEVDPAAVDWEAYDGRDFPYMLRQEPGPGNALGHIKFIFPNRYHVYLHDTPSRELFEHTARAFSSGCIRVERPLELAELVLADSGRWNVESLSKAVTEGRTRNIDLERPIPVLLLYWTAAVDAEGAILFHPDIYARDAPLLRALNAPVDPAAISLYPDAQPD